MTDVAANTSTTAVADNGIYKGQLETSDDRDWIAVELTAGVTYNVKALGSDSDNGSAQYLDINDIYDANGNAVSHDREDHYVLRQDEDYFTTEAHTIITPTQTGVYYVSVSGWHSVGGTGSYTLYVTQDQLGGSENDSIRGSTGADSLSGGCGDDTLSGGDSDDYLDGEWGNDLLIGGDGADTFRFYSDNWDDIRDNDADLWGNDTVADFDPSEDTLHFAGRILRNFDDLTVTESGGNTILTTAWGDSVTLLNVSADDLTDADIRYRLGVRILGSNLEGGDGDDTLAGDEDDNIIYGRGGDDVISGGDGHDYLRGFEGNDSINGGADIDVIGGEEGDDTLSGGDGDDYILSNDGDDIVRGDAGDDLLEAGNGNDSLIGGTGADTLRPGMDNDTMTGGSGADIFVIGRSWGDDRITDFNINADILDFQGSGLDIEDLTVAASGTNTVISADGNSLTLVGVDTEAFNAAIDDLILGAGTVTSYYIGYDSIGIADAPTDDILTTTGVIDQGLAHWEPDDDGVTRVSFSFIDGDFEIAPIYDESWWVDAGEPVTPYTQYIVEQEIARIESYTNLDMVWVEDTNESMGQIRMGYHQFVIGAASTTPFEASWAGDVWTGIHVGEEFLAGYFAHEMGHSLGFADLPEWNEFTGQDYTIMSYVLSARHENADYSSIFSDSYQWADIAGLQYLYGVDAESTAGDDTFSYALAEGMIETIFDAGGTDTIEVTGTGDAVHIDLTPGSWSNIGPDIVYTDTSGEEWVDFTESGTLFIMPNTVIENAKGSSGNDTLTGNSADNLLIGFGGDDMVAAAAGNDTVWAGGGDSGDDTLMGEAGADILGGGAGDDLLVGGSGADAAFGGSGDDTLVAADWSNGAATTDDSSVNALWAGDGTDMIYGADGDDQLGGGLGNDVIYGNGGDDFIYSGQSGNDEARGGNGNDVIFGGTGNDIVSGGGGNDELYGGSGDDIVEGGSGADSLFGGAGNDSIKGGVGDDALFPGGGDDTLVFEAGDGNDTVSGFSLTDDTLDLSATTTDFTALADVQAASTDATQDGQSGVLIDTGGGDSIFLIGINLEDIAGLQASL